MSPTESISGCGGQRSRDRVEQERDGGENGGFCSTRLILPVSAQTSPSLYVGKRKHIGLQLTAKGKWDHLAIHRQRTS